MLSRDGRGRRLTRRGLLRGAMLGAGALATGQTLAACGRRSSRVTPSARSGAASPVRGGTLTLALQSDITSLDPLKSAQLTDRRIQYQIFDALVGIDPQLQLVPSLATSWETADPTVLVFKLRSGVKFHDGSSLDAGAVKYNLDRILQTPGSPRLSEIAGVQSVEAIDPGTVAVSLKAPQAPLLSQLADRAGMILSRAAIEKLGDGLSQNATGAGTGPFAFVDYKKDNRTTLSRNPNYWRTDASAGALPYLDRLIIRPVPDETQRFESLKTGEIDFADQVPEKDVAAMKQDPTLVYAQIPSLSYYGFYLNCQAEPFTDMRVRQALAWSISRQEIVDTVFLKVPVVANGPIAPPQFPYDPNFKPYSRDISRAKSLLNQAGHTAVSFTMLVQAGEAQHAQEAQLLKDQIDDAGFTLAIEEQDLPAIVSQVTRHNFQAALVGWSGRLDPDGNTWSQFHTGGGNNFGQYSSTPMDVALDHARQSFDTPTRKALYQQVNALAAADAPYVFIYHDVTGQYSTVKVKNFTPVADGIYRFVDVWKAR